MNNNFIKKSALTSVTENVTPKFHRSRLCIALKAALLAPAMMMGVSHAQSDLPVEYTGDSRFNIESIITNTNDMTVTQNGQVAWVKWDTYNVGSDNSVAYNYTEGGNNFHALNFILGTEISQIQGNISSDGNVYIYNSNGIVFSNTAVINVAGLLASTQSPSSESIDSIATQLADGATAIDLDVVLSGEEGAGAIQVNDAASITSTINDITLIAETISAADTNGDSVNDAVVLNSQGSINLFANNRSTVTIDTTSDVFSVEVTESLESDPQDSLIDMQNSQMIAQVGVNISALSAQALTMNAINTTGIVQADSVTIEADGSVVLGDITTETLTATVSAGDVTDEGIVNAGYATFTMSDTTEANITLDSADNDIFTFSAFGDNINDITLVDNFGMVLNGIEADVFTLTTTGDVLQSDRFVIGDAFITAALNDSRFNIYLDWVPDDGVSFNEVDHFGAIGHNVYLIDAGGVNLTGISAQRDLIVSSDAAITQTGSLDVLNNAYIYAVDADNIGYNITLEHDFNNFGTLYLAGNEVSIVDRDSLVLGDVEVATSLLATVLFGDITDTGTIIAPFTTFNALDNTEANIFLDSLNNNIDVFAAIGDNINEINLVDNGGIILDGVMARMFTLDTTGEVSQSDVLNIGDAFISAADSTTTYNIDLSLVLDDNSTFNQIGAFGGVGNNISILDGEGILLTGVTAKGDLLILTDGDITQSYALNIAGNTMLSALGNNGTGFNIILDDANNNLGTFHGVGAEILIVDGFGLELGDIDVENTLSATSLTGNITDSGVILAPDARFFAEAGNITLDSLSNQFGVFSASGNTVSVFHENGLVLGDINAENLIATVESGDVTDSGVVNAGSATFNMGDSTEANITLDSARNDIFSFSAFGDNINDITLVDNFGMVLNGIEADVFTLTTTGDVLQSDRFVIGDAFITAALNDSRFNIYLDWVPDDGVNFNQVDHFGAIGHNVYLIDAGGVNLTGISAQRDLIVSSDAAITQTGSLDVLNNAYIYAVDADNVGYNITLEHDFNNFGTLHLAGNEVSIVDRDGLVLGDVEVATSLLVSVLSGDITDTGTINAPFATFNALDNTEANILLDSLNNRIEVFAAIGENINEINLVDNGGIILDGVTARMFTLDTTGEVSQSDVLNIGDAFISAADGTTTYNIDLSLVLDDNNTFNQIGAFGGIGNNISIIDGEGILLTGVTVTGDLLILTDGDITQERSAFGALDIAGNTMLSALNNNGTGFNIILDNANNNLGTFHATAADILLVDNSGLALGNVDANSLVLTSSGNITQTADTAVTLELLDILVNDGDSISLDSTQNSASTVMIASTGDVLIEQLNFVANDDNTDSINIAAQGSVMVNRIVAEASDIFVTANDHALTMFTNDEAQITGNNVSVKVGGVIGLNRVTAANNVELIAFGEGTEQAPLTLTVVNPVEAGGVVGAAISEQGSVELASTLDNLQFYTVTGEYSAEVTLGLEEGSQPSPGVIAGLPQPEPEPEPEPQPDTSAEEELATELFATGQRSLTIPARRPVPIEPTTGFEIPAVAVKLPEESDAVR